MGNINLNYKNFVCDNYYCQEVSFKPEWLSELTWGIDYNYNHNDNDNDNDNDNEHYKPYKPYKIDKGGILTITDAPSFNLLLSKKLLINFNEIKNIIIPINFKYNVRDEISIHIVFSNKKLSLNDVINLDKSDNIFNIFNIFNINLKLFKNKIIICRSFNDVIINRKIKSKKINYFNINLENNCNIFLIKEKLNNIYEDKYLNQFNLDENNEYYLNIYINSKKNISNKEFIMLKFD
jgi:hypothetical protein